MKLRSVDEINKDDLADISRLLDYPGDVRDAPGVVANAGWALDKLCSAELANCYSKEQLELLSARFAETQQDCQNQYIDQIQQAVRILNGQVSLPKTLIAEVLELEDVHYSEEQIEIILTEMRNTFLSGQDDLEELYQDFRKKVRLLCNKLELKKMYQQTVKLLGTAKADGIFSQWDAFSDDIRTNKRIFSNQDKRHLVRHFIEPQCSAELDSRLKKLKKELRTGELPVNPALANHCFGGLLSKMNDGQIADMHVVLNKELVIKQLKRQEVRQISPIERYTYNMLGIDTKPLRDAKALDEHIALFLFRILNDENLSQQSFEQLQEQVQKIQMKIRYLSLGGKEQNFDLVRVLIDSLVESCDSVQAIWQERLDDGMLRLYQENPLIEAFPLNERFIRTSYQQFFQTAATEYIKQFMKTHRKMLRPFTDADQYKSVQAHHAIQLFLLQHLTQNDLQHEFDQKFEQTKDHIIKSLVIYKKYQTELIKEFIQGLDDEQEVFAKGVCFALTSRVSKELAQKPTRSLADMAIDLKILPIDRYHQAAYRIKFNVGNPQEKHQHFPQSMINKENGPAQSSVMNRFRSLNDFDQTDKQALQEQLTATNGICIVNFAYQLGGHSLFFVVDDKNGRYGVFDCNIGLFDFSYLADNPVTALERVFECLHDVLNEYDEINQIHLEQHINLDQTTRPRNG